MQTLTITSDNKNSLKAIKAFAKEQSDVTITVKKEEETDEYFYLKGVRVRKAKGKLDIEKISGSIPNLNMDPKTFRKKIWSREKV
jgi:hypothetical protein